MTEALRVLLLDDSAADAEFVRCALQRVGLAVVTERVDSKAEFARALSDFAPDVVLSDHSLKRFDAPAALAILLATRPSVPLIIVAREVDVDTIVACLRVGADDIVLKSNLSRLPEAIDAAISKRRPLAKLSPRQLQVLRLVAEGHTSPEIGRRLALSVKTIETHRTEVMKRLGIHDVVALVRYAVRVGLIAA